MFLDTQILLFLWSVIRLFTSALRSDHLAVGLLFFSYSFNSFSCLLYSYLFPQLDMDKIAAFLCLVTLLS